MNAVLVPSVRDRINLDAELATAMARVRDRRHRPHPGFQRLALSPHAPQCGVARVVFDGHAYYPDDTSSFALIVAVAEGGDLIDLAAVDFQTARIATRLGIGTALGLDVIDAHRWNQRPLKLFASPWWWLHHPTRGAFIVDWRSAPFTLADLSVIRCQTVDLEKQVRRAFGRPPRMPHLEVPQSSRSAHHGR